MMTAAEKLKQLRSGHRPEAVNTLLDWVDGEPGWVYVFVEYGPVATLVEASLRGRGYEVAPLTDKVKMLAGSGLERTEQEMAKAGQYRVWRAPAEWQQEELVAKAPASLKPKNHEIERLRAQLEAMERMR